MLAIGEQPIARVVEIISLITQLRSKRSARLLSSAVAAPLVAIMDILHDELYRKRFLPTVTDADLERLARKCLHEKLSEDK